MEQLLKAAGMNSPTTSPSSLPAAHLDVALCYKQLNNLKKSCPEDVVMRQALELYCSLITPPPSPSSSLTLGYQPQREDLAKVNPSHSFHTDRQCKASTIMLNLEPTISSFDASKEYHHPFANNFQRDFYHAPPTCGAHICSTVSSISDQDISDSDDMDDDPFASYPLSYSNRLVSHSHAGYNSWGSLAPLGRVSPATSTTHGTSTHSARNHGSTPFAQAPSVQQSRNLPRPKTSGGVMRKASSVDVPWTGNPLSASQGRQFNLNVQPASDSKPTTRKRAFSIVTFGKHRKDLPAESAAPRMSGQAALPGSNFSSSAGTFSAQTHNHQKLGKRCSILGCLSPAIEETEDITSFKIPPSVLARSITSPTHTRSSTSSSLERFQAVNTSNKFSSRSESRSYWKTLTS